MEVIASRSSPGYYTVTVKEIRNLDAIRQS
nr:MAG TPA: hypothetical protein [Caudoviricetes sp.]